MRGSAYLNFDFALPGEPATIIIYGSQLENVSNGGNIYTFTHKYAGECIIFHIEDLEYSNDPDISSITKCRTDGNVNVRMAEC